MTGCVGVGDGGAWVSHTRAVVIGCDARTDFEVFWRLEMCVLAKDIDLNLKIDTTMTSVRNAEALKSTLKRPDAG